MVASIERPIKWLITGAQSQLGRAMQEVLSKSGVEFLALSHLQLDITNEDQITRILRAQKPDVVLNTAAWTNVDAAEDSEDAARLINAHGPRLLAKACSTIGSKFVHISTDYVFSATSKSPWDEAAKLTPESAYGRTKAEGEQHVQDQYKEGSYIVRTAWLYSPWGRNFVKSMLQLALDETKTVKVVNDQIGQPTSALDLAAQIQQLVARDLSFGIYHGTNSGQASWYEFAREIFSLIGANPDRIFPINTAAYPRPAVRPTYSVLGHKRWIDEGILPMREWHEVLEEAIPSILASVRLGD